MESKYGENKDKKFYVVSEILVKPLPENGYVPVYHYPFKNVISHSLEQFYKILG